MIKNLTEWHLETLRTRRYGWCTVDVFTAIRWRKLLWMRWKQQIELGDTTSVTSDLAIRIVTEFNRTTT